jgi:hypothetical protein
MDAIQDLFFPLQSLSMFPHKAKGCREIGDKQKNLQRDKTILWRHHIGTFWKSLFIVPSRRVWG